MTDFGEFLWDLSVDLGPQAGQDADDLRAAAEYIEQLEQQNSRLLDAILDAHIIMGEDMSDGLPTWPEPAELLARSAKEWRAEYDEVAKARHD
jgi:hypothetical protein